MMSPVIDTIAKGRRIPAIKLVPSSSLYIDRPYICIAVKPKLQENTVLVVLRHILFVKDSNGNFQQVAVLHCNAYLP